MERQELLCVEASKRAPSFLKSGKWTDCKFVVGAEPHQVVVSAHKLVMAMASPVFEAMFYGGLAETRDHIPIADVAPEIFKSMLRYIYSGNIKLSSCGEASEICYIAKKYLLNQLVEECSNYLRNNVNLGNVCQLYEHSQLFDDAVLTQKCINIFTVKTKELLQDSSFKDAALSTVEKIFSLDQLNIDSEVDLINAAALYVSAQDDEEVRISNGAESNSVSHEEDNAVNRLQIRSVVRHIRLLTLTPQQYADCTARSSLLSLSEDHAVFVNIASNKPNVPMPSGLSTSRIHRNEIDKARSEATFRFTVQNFSSLQNELMSPVFYVGNLPWQLKIYMTRIVSSKYNSHIKYLCCVVTCNAESESSRWMCDAHGEIRLICHRPLAEPRIQKFQYLYTSINTERHVYFLPWDTVLDPTQGYIQNDAITLEVHVTAEEPQGVM